MNVLKLNRPQWGWVLYDWANSAYYTTVMAGFFPIFFKKYWSEGSVAESTLALGAGNSLASLLMVLSAPLLGAMADRGGLRIKLLTLFIAIGCLACGSLFFVGQGHWKLAVFLYVLGTFAIASGNTFYDALLPSVAPNDEHRVSAIGFSAGYLGGGLLFLINVLMSLQPQMFGLADSAAGVKWSFVSVAVWWALFSLPVLLWVKEPPSDGEGQSLGLRESFASLKATMGSLFEHRNLGLFLIAFWFYIDGVHTAIRMAADYGLAIGFAQEVLIQSLLLVQFVGFPAGIMVAKLSEKYSSIRIIRVCIVVYIITTLFAVNMSEAWHFYVLALLIGLVQGGIQSLSRSQFLSMIPDKTKSAAYCGLYNITGKAASTMGPLLVGFVALLTENPRMGMGSIIILFVIGYVLLNYVKVDAPAEGPSE